MAKPNLAGKLKEMARNMKEEESSQGGVKKLGDKIKQGMAHKKETNDGGKASGRKV